MTKSILVCDDDYGILEVVQLILAQQGYEVITVQDSHLIFDTIKKHRPDLILLDLWMPHLTGQEISIRLKANAATQQIPIVILSAHRHAHAICKNIGADECIKKPFDIDVLEETVAKYVGLPTG